MNRRVLRLPRQSYSTAIGGVRVLIAWRFAGTNEKGPASLLAPGAASCVAFIASHVAGGLAFLAGFTA